MKKLIIAIISIFAFTSCTEDSLQDINVGGVENDSGVKNSPSTITITPTMNYQSPYDFATFPNYNIHFEYMNNTNLDIYLTPYLGPIAYQVHEAYMMNPSFYPNILAYAPDVNAIPSMKPLHLSPYSALNIIPCGMATPIIPTPGCGTIPAIFEYGYPSFPTIGSSEMTPLAESSKVYYYFYEIYSTEGLVHSGYIKHKLGDDGWDWKVLEGNSQGQWLKYFDYPALYGTYGTVVMRNQQTGELALSQEKGFPTLPSLDVFTDPFTSITHSIEFRNEINKIVLEVN